MTAAPPLSAATLAHPALGVGDITKAYGPVTALAGVSLSIGQGEVVALVGHSGSGKSTLLRLIAGLERPTRGAIAIAGRDVSGRPFVPPEERGVGMMFQDYALFPHLSVIDNVAFGLNRLPRAEARARAEAALDRIGLRHRAGDFPHALSGGEQQRVALVRALVPAPGILLMDEPFSNLDRRTRDRVRDDTAAILRESNATAILVTHDPEDAMRVADRVLIMAAGRIVRGGTAEELHREPGSLLVARFFADYNEIEAPVAGGLARTALGTFAAPGVREGATAVVCIRPHALSIEPQALHTPSATVVGRAFVGDEVVFLVKLSGVPRPLQVRAPAASGAVVGDRVAVTLDPSQVLVFAAE